MADQEKPVDSDGKPAAATKAPPKKSPSKKRRPKQLPRYKVLLHNDDHNDMLYVVSVIRKLTGMSAEEAVARMLEAHNTGVAMLLVTHKERAELYVEQFASCRLTATMEPE